MSSKFLKSLSSSDHREVVKTLFALGGQSMPSDEVAARVLELAAHEDPDIRERAVFDIGIHWALPQSYNLLLNMLRGAETDELVIHAAIGGLGVLIQHGAGDITEVSRVLAKLALSEHALRKHRDHANRTLMMMHRKITVAEYGKGVVLPELIPWDGEWLGQFTK